MKIDTLVSTMNTPNPLNLINRMKIESDVIMINQTNYNSYKAYNIKKNIYRVYSFDEIGVGLSRNSALMRSFADICIMADDDMVYREGYLDEIKKAYKQNPNADMIVFNVNIYESNNIRQTVKKSKRVRWYNCLRYGTVTFTFKRESILKINNSFSLLFGGGAKYGSGEDSLFIWNAINKGLKVYAVNKTIADVYNNNSTWFEGYNEKFYKDKGALFAALNSRYYWIFNLQYVMRHPSKEYSRSTVLNLMQMGAKEFLKRKVD
ncbi:glycosyltransferase family A protein [Vagococcus lutrae]|uniref:glycosyltransferase family A protein n=1 Tax=Vagococcus lutrae TaxID=81947 RepID=UPI0028929275|nr:glycosyltransferase family A protein [Vagococcus lutrae]MDT2802003.1 glycosyltransferase family A protein [Vagococcus lutrae]